MLQPKTLPANTAQLRAILSLRWARIQYLIWSRGTGKSFYIAWFMIQVVRLMPGSKWTFVGPTYAKLLSDILPGIVDALEMFGYKKDLHYFVGKMPPKSWEWKEAFQPPLDGYDHCIVFHHPERCVVFQLGSMDRNVGGRGVNTDGLIVDEALLINREKFIKSFLPANRGNQKRFGHINLHHGILYCSSMPYTQEGSWMLEGEQLAKQDKSVYFSEANVFENLANVGMKYIQDLQKEMTPFEFNVEVLNQRVTKLPDGFYPNFDSAIHCYDESYDYGVIDSLEHSLKGKIEFHSKMDKDCIANQPLEISVDWGANITSMVVGQEQWPYMNLLNEFYVKNEILDNLAKKFCHYYRFHQRREVFFWYDRTGNSRMANSPMTMAEQFTTILVKHGWTVHYMVHGADPEHSLKYQLINKILLNSPVEVKYSRLPIVQINKNNCPKLIISIERAPIKQTENGIKKDKGSERKKNIDQAEATHLSDAFDLIMYGKYKNRENTGGSGGFRNRMLG